MGQINGLSFEASHNRLVQLSPGAQPILVDADGHIVGLSMDSGAYRLIYVPIAPALMSPLVYQRLMEVTVDFFGAPPTVPSAPGEGAAIPVGQLRIDRILGLSTTLDNGDPIRAGVILDNQGGGVAKGWQLDYKVFSGREEVAAYRVPVPTLIPGQRRIVALPVWQPPLEGNYQVQLSITAPGQTTAADRVDRLMLAAGPQGGFSQVELKLATQSNGAGFFDYDSDGDLDLYITRLNRTNALYRNDGAAFDEVGASAGVADEGDGRGLAIGDYDGDGDLDLYLVNEARNRLYSNSGDGSFAEVGRRWTVDDGGSGRSAGFFDYDSDGDLDLYLVNAKGANRLYRNDGYRFSHDAQAGLDDRGDGRGLAIGDYDGDGDPDVFVTNLYSNIKSQLYANDSGRFTPVSAALGLFPLGREVAAVFGDTDNDNDLDLFLSNQEGDNELWLNRGAQGFSRAGTALGKRCVGAAFFDYDNDGDLDLVTTAFTAAGGGDQIFQNLEGASAFMPVGTQLGLRSASAGRGIALGDYDGDGRQDLLVADAEHSILYRNRLQTAPWLQVELKGTDNNRYALGARAELSIGGQVQMRELQPSYGYGSQMQPLLHFGLGQTEQVDWLRIQWPDGRRSHQSNIEPNQRLVMAYPQRAKPAAESVAEAGFALGENHPNPFNGTTVIPFRLGAEGRVFMAVYNLSGQRVRLLAEGPFVAGDHRLVWDGRDQGGAAVASGLYLVQLRANGQRASRRLMLVK